MPVAILPALVVLRLIAWGTVAAAIGAVVATAGSSLAGGAEWLRPIFTSVLTLAIVLGIGGTAIIFVMPSTAELRRNPPDDHQTLPAAVIVVLEAVALGAALHASAVVAWWTQGGALLGEVTGGTRDALGLWIIPAAAVFAKPILAAIGLVAFVLSAILAMAAPTAVATRAMAACAALQGGLVGGLFLTDRTARQIGTAVQQFVDSGSDRVASAQVGDWLARYDAVAASSVTRLTLLFAGYLLALAIASTRRPSPQVASTRSAAPHAPPPPPAIAPAYVSPSRPAVLPSAVSTDPAVFTDSAYSVRARTNILDAFVARKPEYEIASIPPTRRSRFSFSWKTGTLTRESDGAAVLIVQAMGGGVFGGTSYAVANGHAGAPLGTLVPNGSDWEARDVLGQLVAHVLVVEERAGRALFVAKAGDIEIWRFVWGFTGLTAATAELQIEFLAGADARFRPLAVALGPLLEHRARRTSRRGS